MNFFKILSHPYILLLSFLFILISGEHHGGFYAMYLFLGLPSGVIHSVLGFAGIAALVVNYHFTTHNRIRQALNLAAVFLLFTSIFLFFRNDTAHYNWGSFEQGLPMFSLILASFISLCFIVGTFWQPPAKNLKERSFLSKV